MKYPHKYFLDEEKIVWEKKFFFRKETTTVEINFKDIERIRFMPVSWICRASSMEIYSKDKKITVYTQSVGLTAIPESKYVAEYEAIVCVLLEKIYDDKTIKYSKGGQLSLIVAFVIWIGFLPIAFFSWQLSYDYFTKCNFLMLIATAIPPLISLVGILFIPSFFINSIPKKINPEHILKYSPKVLFNRAYRKFIYEETGEKID